MKTRYLNVVLLAAASAGFGLAACDTGSSTLDPNVEARLRNNLPSACTADQIKACPAVNVTRCPDGQEPVIDYSADCCPHFTCQPLCQAAARTCLMTPAPICPARTKLWIGTAIEDCCPAYRCEPDGSVCDPTVDKCVCDTTNVACTLALPYCGPGVDPVIVGQTADCCPVYQCPCTPVIDATGVATTPANCGCTTPSCKAGEQIVCDKKDVCGGPCRCEPARGACKDNSSCAADETCDLSACRLPPPATTAAGPNAPTCDASKCGPALGLPNKICPDGSTAGPTNRCLLNADGSCGWEVRDCPPDPTACYGVCVPNITAGCRVDTDCPSGQMCDVQCSGWGCSVGGTTTGGTPGPTTDPSTGTSVPPTPVCACPTSDPTCVCDANGNCKGQTCAGKCVPRTTTCDPNKPVACPTFAPVCPNGQTPIPNGIDPNTCCQTYTCPVCDRATTNTSTGAPSVCAAPACACAKIVATDPATCCPKYECGVPKADGTCG